jgi:hypothetical protein
MKPDTNPLCPPNCTHLLTMPEATGYAEARAELIEVVGVERGTEAVIRAGHYGPDAKTRTPWGGGCVDGV